MEDLVNLIENISIDKENIDESNYFTFNGVKSIDDSLPVSHISFYEACAFAKYKDLRLPTEFELEYFLSKTSKFPFNESRRPNFDTRT